MKHIFKKQFLFLLLGCVITATFGCKKFLDEKQNQVLVIPQKVQDLQGIIDDYTSINNDDVSEAEISADNYYLNETDYNSLSEFQRNAYIWNSSRLFEPGNNNTWVFMYMKVYKANVVLYEIDNIDKSNITDWNNLKGQALFLRAKSFLQIASVWAQAYDPETANSDLGIPLRLDPNFNNTSVRSTVQQTYDQIVTDLKEAIPLLPATPLHVLRSSKAAAFGMLARTYLFMRNYEQAGLYADSCLQLKNTLMDYNVPIAGFFIPTDAYPFRRFNPEIIYEENMLYQLPLYYGSIVPELYGAYQDNDLRKKLFFSTDGIGPESFRGDYDGSSGIFAGLATDEVYLMRAECHARNGNIDKSMQDLNTLMIKRWKADGSFLPITASEKNDALRKILEERRKELVFRRLRWMDIKRLNKEGENIVLKRTISGKEYVLSPNDLKYALPIPDDVILISGMPQNPR